MGTSPAEFPEQPEPTVRLKADTTSTGPPEGGYYVSVPAIPAPQRDPLARYVILFLATVYSTTYVGASHYLDFYQGFGDRLNPFTWGELMVRGLWYSVPILAILGCHELGHYLACRYYGVAASRPYFIPMPLVLTGTLGAFIRIRRPIPGKRELFDIGIAGPIAGFVIAVPLLFMGMYLSRVVELPRNADGVVFWLGEPLLFKAAAWLTFGHVADGYTITMHPVAFAAWFGLLATALNLFPIGQLDGGHISYAVLGRKSTVVTLVMAVCLIGLAFWSLSWAVWAGLTVTMLVVFGPHHPRTADENVPLDSGRKALAIFAVIMFILCFTPAPIEPMDLVTRP
jgi:membrane-associated protease RseP (regulator of RpoE activity)